VDNDDTVNFRIPEEIKPKTTVASQLIENPM
jgi:hypothetical protein